jgi:hypothetical protein
MVRPPNPARRRIPTTVFAYVQDRFRYFIVAASDETEYLRNLRAENLYQCDDRRLADKLERNSKLAHPLAALL